ncbi:channel-forming protein ArfA/OmpATb [Mycolicibacter minnesotensis]
MRARLIGATLATALLAAIGYGLLGRAHQPVAVPQPAAAPVPVSVTRHGTEFTLAGDVADPAAKRELLDAVITSSDDVTVIDRLGVVPGAVTVDFSGAAPVFEAAAGIGDFTVAVTGDTVTLRGTAAKADEAAAVQAAAEDAWVRARIVNELATSSQSGEKSTKND